MTADTHISSRTSEAPARTAARSDTLALWAGRILVFICAAHLLLFGTISAQRGHLIDWLTGGLLMPDQGWSAPMTQSEAFFWPFLGSFAVPLLLVGLLICRLARLGQSVPGWLTCALLGWVLTCTVLMEPSGFPAGLVPVVLLWRAQHLRRRQS